MNNDSFVAVALSIAEGEQAHLIRTRDIFQADYDDGVTGYGEQALAIVRDAKNAGIPDGCNAAGAVGQNKRTTVAAQLYARVNPETERIEACGFRARGCLAMIAAASKAAQLIEGKTLAEATTLTAEQLREEVGEVPAMRSYTFAFAIEAIRALVGDFRIRQGIDWEAWQTLPCACDPDSIACISCEICSLRTSLADLHFAWLMRDSAQG